MSYRRIFLACAAVFVAYLLWLVIDKDSATAISAVWPLIVAFIAILMLPERRLQGDLFVRLVAAMRGQSIDIQENTHITQTVTKEDEKED